MCLRGEGTSEGEVQGMRARGNGGWEARYTRGEKDQGKHVMRLPVIVCKCKYGNASWVWPSGSSLSSLSSVSST